MQNHTRILLALLVSLSFGCPSTVADWRQMDAMDPQEFNAYKSRIAAQTAMFANAALQEGDLTPEAVAAVGRSLQGIADGTVMVGMMELSQAVDLEGYNALALMIALTELDAFLQRRGAYVDGYLTEQGRDVIRAAGKSLIDLAARQEA